MDWIAIIGTVAFTVSGYLVGVRKHCDVLGIIILALLTAIGGGMIRDVLIQRIPQVFLYTDALWVIAATLVTVSLLRLQKRESQFLLRTFIVADSLGLVAFSIAGAQVGLQYELNGFGVAMLGFITVVGGGMVRDMMVNAVPFILHKDFYGTVAILIALSIYLLEQQSWLTTLSLHLVFAIGLVLRLFAHWRELELPKLAQDND